MVPHPTCEKCVRETITLRQDLTSWETYEDLREIFKSEVTEKVFLLPLPWNDHLYLGSVGYPALSHSTQPPFKAHT